MGRIVASLLYLKWLLACKNRRN